MNACAEKHTSSSLSINILIMLRSLITVHIPPKPNAQRLQADNENTSGAFNSSAHSVCMGGYTFRYSYQAEPLEVDRSVNYCEVSHLLFIQGLIQRLL